MTPVHKSVRANPLKMMGKGVREKFFFQIAVKIRRFPRTAITDNTAMSVDIVISRWHEAKDRLWGSEVVLLLHMKLAW